MKATVPDPETWLEVGVVAFSLALLAAVGVLLAGRLRGDAGRRRRYAEAPPGGGSVGAERHRNVGAVAAR